MSKSNISLYNRFSFFFISRSNALKVLKTFFSECKMSHCQKSTEQVSRIKLFEWLQMTNLEGSDELSSIGSFPFRLNFAFYYKRCKNGVTHPVIAFDVFWENGKNLNFNLTDLKVCSDNYTVNYLFLLPFD